MKKLLSILVAVLILVGLVGCAASENTDQSGATKTAQNKSSILNPEEAQAVALNHAAVTADQVTLLHTRYEVDDGVPEYEVEFRYEDQEYDYTIHAETGEILEFDQELERSPTQAPTEPQSTEPPATETATEPAAPAVATEPPATEAPQKAQPKLSREDARDIALNHAGFKKSQVKRLEIEYDVDDGIPEYSVEFYADGWEYDYEIHAETGKILEHHKERD